MRRTVTPEVPDGRIAEAERVDPAADRYRGRDLVLSIVCWWVIFTPAPADAWGEKAHRLVAGVAEALLDEPSRRAARALIGPGGLVEAAVWADRIRATRPDTAPWHYVNISMEDPVYDARRHCAWPASGDCVVAAIERFRATLADRGAAEAARAEALKFLVHFVADVHQPLHCLAELRGGNDLVVDFLGEPTHPRTDEPWNLHAVWDAGLVEQTGWREDEHRRRLLDLVARQSISLRGLGTPADWATESHRLAVEIIRGLAPSRKIGRDEAREGLQVIERQIALAAVRLARLLRAALAEHEGR